MNELNYKPPYRMFGELLARLRVAGGFDSQAALASALRVAQQSVSRWEKGTGRPRAKEIPALEQLLNAKPGELLAAAGYASQPSGVTTITQTVERPLPLSALSPDSFESFCAALLSRHYRPRGGTVNRYGKQGHDQRGIDILAAGSFGTHTFQCKRVESFGPQKVHTAVVKQTYAADLKVLLLSLVASTDSRDAIRTHPGWELWDREDITRRFHELPQDDRRDLIDLYFGGQRMALLGSDERTPFQRVEDFFKHFLIRERFFNHTWPLVGRRREVDEIVQWAREEKAPVELMIGAAGAGKTRVFREVAELLAEDKRRRVRFVSQTEEIKVQHLDLLRDVHETEVLLCVDDAHEREDLGLLLRYAANPENKTRLLMALRPYSKEDVRLQAAEVGLLGEDVRCVELTQQTREDAQALAHSVLEACGGPTQAAEEIARATVTTPLVTVLAAQLTAKAEFSLELLNNADQFRTYLLARLQDVITATLVTGQDVGKLQAVLRTVALLQPVAPDDPRLLELLLKVEEVEQADATRLMRLLNDAGVLFKRGLRYRLAPDLLADEILRTNYLDGKGSINGRVLKVFDEANGDQLKHLFVNLGRLDWRLREGRTDDSALLRSLLPRLRWGEEYHHPHVEAVEAVAYYQPRFALDFAKRLVDEGHGTDGTVCSMIRNAAYTYDHVDEACRLLWRAGHKDDRALNSTMRHGVRLFKELAEFGVNKPIEYVERVVDIAIELLDRPSSFNGAYTPFEILEAPLEPEVELRTYSGFTVSIGRSTILVDAVSTVRNKVVDTLLKYLREGSTNKAYLAAATLAHALTSPRHGDSTKRWRHEHRRVLEVTLAILEEEGAAIHPVVLYRVAQSVSWHVRGFEENAVLARGIISLLARDLRTRLTRSLLDGWGTETWELSEDLQREEHEVEQVALAQVLMERFDDPAALLVELRDALDGIASIAGRDFGSPHMLTSYLLEKVPRLARTLLAMDRDGIAGELSWYVGVALGVAVSAGETDLVDEYISRSETSPDALVQLAQAYASYEPDRPYNEVEVRLFRRLFASEVPRVLGIATQMIRSIAKTSPALAVDLACSMDLHVHPRATHNVFMWLSGKNLIAAEHINPRRSELLNKLLEISTLDDYWVRAFIKTSLEANPSAVLEFIKERLKTAPGKDDWSYAPFERERHGNDDLKLLNAKQGSRHLCDLLAWSDGYVVDHRTRRWFAEAVAGLCGDYNAEFLGTLLAWMRAGSVQQAQVVSAILWEAQPNLIYDHPAFPRDVLNAAEMIGDEAVRDIRSAISSSARSGIRGGTPGEPFPEDEKLERHCLDMLATLSRVEPTRDLFEELLADARREMARQRQTKEAYEEFDD